MKNELTQQTGLAFQKWKQYPNISPQIPETVPIESASE
ncbi:hypothetical protein M2347_000159 [Chryseobacterium sp. H1D6B]|nr:hypothetical protein [Chryseobacterium sp. H1D6B]